MPDLIQVPYSELFQRSNSIRQQAQIVEEEINRLDEVIESLEWMGNRGGRFKDHWHDAVPVMRDWVQTLRNFADDLNNQGQRMKAADERG
jgi:WXG100 family type VII secretion target